MRKWEEFLRVHGWKSDYSSVDNLLRHYRRKVRSDKTRANACEAVFDLCRFAGCESPDELVALAPEKASSLVQDFVDDLRDRDRSIRYINSKLAYLQTFYRRNGFEGDRALKVDRYHQPSRYRKRIDYVPTSEEIYRMAYASKSLRNRALILGLYTSGLRNSTLRALLYRDVKEELEAGLDIIKAPVYPEMKEVTAHACKGNIPYYSFFDPETTTALRQYLEERIRSQGEIRDDEPLFCSTTTSLPLEKKRRIPVRKRTLEETIKKVARYAGIKNWRDVRPKSLRVAYESALRNARLDPKDQEFLMGHILPGSQDAYYDSTKIEELRKKYRQIVFFPHAGSSTEELRKKAIIDFAKYQGSSEDEIKKLEEILAKYATMDEAVDEIRKLRLEPYKERRNVEANGGGIDCEERTIASEDLDDFLQSGWRYVDQLRDGRVVVRRL